MINAKEEFIDNTDGLEIEMAIIKNVHYLKDNPKEFVLNKGYSFNDFSWFLKQLNFEYYNGYGTMYLDGYVWFTDGTWLERREYDGSEWWHHVKRPLFESKK